MRKLVKFAVVVGTLALASGCAKDHVKVSARSEGLSTYQCSVGRLNTAGFSLGDVVAVDPQTHRSWKAAAIEVDPLDTRLLPKSSGTVEPVAQWFDLSCDRSPAPLLMLNTSIAVRADSEIHVENCYTKALKDPGCFAAGNEKVLKTVAKARAEHPEAKLYLVSAITSADKVYLTFGNQGDSTRVGKYTVHVDYPQNPKLEQLAKAKPAFYQLTPLKLTKDSDGRALVRVDRPTDEHLPAAQFADVSGW